MLILPRNDDPQHGKCGRTNIHPAATVRDRHCQERRLTPAADQIGSFAVR
jgi:hypothetical protein